MADATEVEIGRRLAEELKLVTTTEQGWVQLHFDPAGATYWELTYPNSELPGGGPRRLRRLSASELAESYGIGPEGVSAE